MFPLILITEGRSLTEEKEVKLQLYENYVKAIELSGGIPAIAGAFCENTIKQYADIADGLVVSGGEDLNPTCYGKERQAYCNEPDDWRDWYELALVKEFVKRRKPILGICRGLQLINVYFGGTLVQDIREDMGEIHESEISHVVVADQESFLVKLFGETFKVNSYHHQAIDRLGSGLVPLAHTANQRIIESISHEELPIFAVQWHPERMMGNNRSMVDKGPDMQSLFSWFIKQCVLGKEIHQ